MRRSWPEGLEAGSCSGLRAHSSLTSAPSPPSSEGCWPGVARRQLTFLLLRQKKSKQKKRRPWLLRPLRFATGQPVVLGPGGVSRKLASLRQARSLIRLALRSSAHPQGDPEYQNSQTAEYRNPQRHAMPCLCFVLGSVLSSAVWSFGLPRPGWAEQRRRRRDKGWRCLSEAQRSEFSQTPSAVEQRRLPVAKRRDPDCGSPFLW